MKLLIEIVVSIIAMIILFTICIVAADISVSKKWGNVYKEGGRDD